MRLKVIILFVAVLLSSGARTTTTIKAIAASSERGYVEEPAASRDPFQAQWKHVSETSAVIYWHLNAMSKEASDSYVEYGKATEYGRRTEALEQITTTRRRKMGSRWAHLHWIMDLEPGKTYHYRMVMTLDGKEVKGKDLTFKTKKTEGAIYIPQDVQGPPFALDRPKATYLLTKDIAASGTTIVVNAADVTLDLDGHTVTFGDDTDKPAYGISPSKKANGKVTIRNGHIRQGKRSGAYSSCIDTRWRAFPVEIYGVSTDVHLKASYPIRIFGRAKEVEIHHNHLYSRVTDIESRHYPGNDLLRVDDGTNIKIHHNLLTEGCHRGITFMGREPKNSDNAEIYENDIRHHQQYVNGHALAGISYARIHHNHVTSTGRGMQIGHDVEIYNNWFSIQGHKTLSDLPQGSRPWKHRRVELHGFKLEGKKCVNVKIHDNFMQITQHLPNDKWDYVPATPLNIACYDPNAMNEVYNNTIVALTKYKKTRHGGYGDSGKWASAIFFVGMNEGPAQPGKYSIYIHDNKFISNHLFFNASREPNMTIRVESNTFILGENPADGHAVFRRIPLDVQQRIKEGNNTFQGMER